MDNIQSNQSKVSEWQSVLAVTGGDPVSFFESNIKNEQDTINGIVEEMVSSVGPEAISKVLEQMIYCLQVLGNETDVSINKMMDDVWSLANLNTLLTRLASATNRIKLYELEIARAKAIINNTRQTSNPR